MVPFAFDSKINTAEKGQKKLNQKCLENVKLVIYVNLLAIFTQIRLVIQVRVAVALRIPTLALINFSALILSQPIQNKYRT